MEHPTTELGIQLIERPPPVPLTEPTCVNKNAIEQIATKLGVQLLERPLAVLLAESTRVNQELLE